MDFHSLNINHYVCKGECRTVSENPGICPISSCSKKGEPLVSCTCGDGRHTEIWFRDTPSLTIEGF